jgi:predicted metal-binding transcription factor (methanogenesis marker protein 9)
MPFFVLALNCGHRRKTSGQYGKTLSMGSVVWCTPCKKESVVIYKTIDER